MKTLQYVSHGFRIAACLLALVCSAAHAGLMVPIDGDPVSIDSGKVAGTVLDSGVHAYFSIPFAAPPVGQWRWRAPQPVKPWSSIYNADSMRPACPSPGQNSSEPKSEDCLNLNIWTPPIAKAGARLPVLVWIHGGSFQGGCPNILGSRTVHSHDGYAVAFAKMGNPATSTAKAPRYDSRNEQRIVFGDQIWIEKLDTAQLEFLRAHPTSGSQQ